MAGITRVVLYKHGVGYFERQEQISGDQELRLTFRSAEMNDVLKSLTLQDLDGGTVHSVSYDTQEPVGKLLQEIALDIPAEGGAAALLGRVRGAKVKVSAGSRELVGQVIGIEKTQKRSADGVESRALLSLLDGNGSLHTVDLAEVAQLTFQDEHIRKDLSFYFDTLIHTYKRDAKNLCIHARGKGKRTLEISYVIECPVWKTSYRMMLPGYESQEPLTPPSVPPRGETLTPPSGTRERVPARGETPFLQGWALIDNTQDEDWVDVRLSLVAGLPISFIHDLYTPRYIKRQEVEVQRESLAGPVMAEGALRTLALAPEPELELELEDWMLDLAAPEAAPAPLPGTARMVERKEAARAMAAQTITQSLGDLFEYSISHPVTVRRNQSALVPIIAHDFQGRRVVLYNRERRPEHPFAAVDFKNTTGLTLEGGPVVVTEADTYAGEAMLDTLKPEESRLVPFAVDLGTAVESDHDHRLEDVHYVRVQHGRLELQQARVETRRYAFDNKDPRRKVCLLEHPIRSGFELWGTPAPREKTHSFYRFELELPAGGATAFEVTERSVQSQWIDLRTITEPQLSLYVSKGYIGKAQETVLREVASLLHSQSKLRGKLQETEQRYQALSRDQDRLRDNLRSLGSTADEARLRSRYVAKLETQENELEGLVELKKRLGAEIDRRSEEVDTALAGLSFEVVVGGEPEEPAPETVEIEPEETEDTDPFAALAEQEPPEGDVGSPPPAELAAEEA